MTNDAAVAFVRISRPTPGRSFRIASGTSTHERIAAARLDEFEFCLDQRMIGHGKRQARYDHIESASPGTSTPPQKLSVPNNTLRGVDLNCPGACYEGAGSLHEKFQPLFYKKFCIAPANCSCHGQL